MISIIVPVYNEAEIITSVLEDLQFKSDNSIVAEIIVVDGGSIDETKTLIQEFSTRNTKIKIRCIDSEKGRARQMNAGASIATGSILYFLHADSIPPTGFDQQISKAVEAGHVAGCFRMRFDKRHPLLLISQWFTRFNLKACRGGDQSLFVRKEVFQGLKGYNETFEVYEDCELTNRIYDLHSFTVLKDHVLTSARKYEKNGTYRLQYHFAVIHLKKWTGASANELSRYYHKHILS